MADWSNERNINFIEDYRSYTCLWNANSDAYKDRAKRNDALMFLKGKYDLGTSKAVLNKIKCFRSYFHRVHKDYMTRKRNGSGAEDVSQPGWVLYKYLLFILDGEERRTGKETDSAVRGDCEDEQSTDGLPEAQATEEGDKEFDEECDESENKIIWPHASGSNMSEGATERNKYKTTANNDQDYPKTDSRRKKRRQDDDSVSDEAISIQRSFNQNMAMRDHISFFGEYVASKIRSLSTSRLQSLAQLKIHQVLYDLEVTPPSQDFPPRQVVSARSTPSSGPNCFYCTESSTRDFPLPCTDCNPSPEGCTHIHDHTHSHSHAHTYTHTHTHTKSDREQKSRKKNTTKVFCTRTVPSTSPPSPVPPSPLPHQSPTPPTFLS
ncbi:uncharacterized protein LOC143021099 [Oratosquilla oratoria]|uniref:uncharacterized protein LOC143021099 n=1 Tax=Oratosquilla oratoria TaxID=337810 RepID=UPI003F757D50